MSNIDDVLAFNREYVASGGYEAHLTDKYPDKKIMVVAHSNCGACHMSFHHFKEEMLKRGVGEDAMLRFPVNLDDWLEGFHDTEKSVRSTVSIITGHPLIPKDIVVRGFIIDSVTGELSEVL